MKKFLVFLLIIHSQLSIGWCQAPSSWTSADIYLALRKLNVLGSVLYIAAHPDDENTRLIAYLSKDKLYRTGYLSLTRGDGGQNLLGDEQGIELGLIRTQELLSARRVDGGEQFFSRAYDFGYSKSPEETFTKWDREKILSDVVWVIRKFQPDVIITRFPATGEGTHGHHTASAILANEAFTAAADPQRFPEQLSAAPGGKSVQPWEAKRICFNGFNFGGNTTQGADLYRVDVGGYNPLVGKSYGEIAAESRSQHKSQGFGVASSRGESMESLRTTGGTAPVNDLMDGVELGWKKIAGGEAVTRMINELVASFDLLHPENSVEGLVKLYKTISGLSNGNWKTQKLKEVEQLVAQCSGLFIDVTTTERYAVQADSIRFNFSFNNRLGTTAELQKIRVDDFDSSIVQVLGKNKNFNFPKTFYVSPGKKITQPYWLENEMEEGYFNVTDQLSIGQPDVDPSYRAIIQIKIFGEIFSFERAVKYKFTDPVKGELYQPLVVVPPVEFDFVNGNNFSINDSLVRVQVHFKSNLKGRDSTQYTFAMDHSDKWRVDKDKFIYGVSSQNMSNYVSAYFRPKQNQKNVQEWLHINARKANVPFYTGYKRSITYDHIPYITYFKKAAANLVQIDAVIYGKKIGYIIGAGDKVPEALEQMGYEVTQLTDRELSRNNLAQFDAIITGVRAYNTNDWMSNHYEKLMKYVNEGGNLIVQYNTSNNIGPVRTRIGPYNFNISRTRVTDENAPVNILKPDHQVLNFPNKIGPEDFKGWIQERSIYHASDWDKEKFETIVSMNDPGEKADEGSLIIARHGKGYFSYTGIVFFRELPAGVPGAYRLLANIIALNKKKAF